jgi:hypothetical protein
MVAKTTTREKDGRAPARYLVAHGGTEGAPGLFLDLSDFNDEQWADLVAAIEWVILSFAVLPGRPGDPGKEGR